MADEKRQLILDILANAKTKTETDKAARDLEHVADAADRANKHTEDLGKSTDVLNESQDRMGKSVTKNAGQIQELDRQIGLTKNELESLHRSYSSTADETEKRDLSKGIRALENDLRKLNKSRSFLSGQDQDRKDLADSLIPDAKNLGETLANKLSGLKLPFVPEMGGVAAPIAAGMAVDLIPLLGGVVASAVIGTAAGAGIVGGVMLAAKDARVAAAGKDLGKTLLTGLQDKASVFVEPLLQQFDKIGGALSGSIGDNLSKIFSSSSQYLAPLTNGLLGFVDQATKGIANAAEAAGPVIEVLSNHLAGIGSAIGDVFTLLSKDGVAAASALDTALTLVEDTIKAVGEGIHLLTMAYEGLVLIGAFGSDARTNYLALEAEQAGKTSDSVKGTADAHGQLASAADGAASSLNGLVDVDARVEAQAIAAGQAINGQRDALIDLSKAERAQSDPVFALIDAEDRLKKSQHDLSDAIKKHGANSKEADKATKQLTDSALDLQTASGQLGNTFNGKLTPEMRQTLKAAGLTDSEIKRVAASFRQAKKDGDKFAGNYNANVTVRVTEILAKGAAVSASAVARALQKRAAGGPVSQGTPYLVGENGPEIVVPSAAGRVLSAAGTRGVARTGIAGTPAGAVATQPRTVQVEVVGNDQKLISLLKYLIRTGNVLES